MLPSAEVGEAPGALTVDEKLGAHPAQHLLAQVLGILRGGGRGSGGRRGRCRAGGRRRRRPGAVQPARDRQASV